MDRRTFSDREKLGTTTRTRLASRADRGSKPAGMIVPGNIDLYNRPEVPNKEAGGTSTVYSTSFTEEREGHPYFGKEVLVPRAVGNRILTENQARRNYEITGQHMGVFDTPENATKYAQQVHEDYAAGKYGVAGKPYQLPDPEEMPLSDAILPRGLR